MLKALRMVWQISRHFNTDDRMTPLMERIANLIASRVKHSLSIKTVLRLPAAEARALLQLSKTVLEKWEENYQEVRRKIELTSDNRWEFERGKLFTRTNYMASICGDLIEIVDKVDEFRQILDNPDLKCMRLLLLLLFCSCC